MEKRVIYPGVVGYSKLVEDNSYVVNTLEGAVTAGAIEWHETTTAPDKEADQSAVNYEKRRGLNFGLFPALFDSPNLHHKELGKLSQYLYDITAPAVQDYKNTYFTHDSIDYFGWVALKYRVDDFFTAHTDASHDFPRQMSVVYYVNSDYEGGELEFPFLELKVKPLAGELIIFPSNYLFLHSANKITSGIKYSVINFIN